MQTKHRQVFKLKMQVYLEADERRLDRLRSLLQVTQDRLAIYPGEPILLRQSETLETIIDVSEAKCTILREILNGM